MCGRMEEECTACENLWQQTSRARESADPSVLKLVQFSVFSTGFALFEDN